jgi:hypothetical protein
MAGAFPIQAKGATAASLNLRNEYSFGAVKSPRPAPSIKREPALGTCL